MSSAASAVTAPVGEKVSFLPVFTLVLWLGGLAVGLVGAMLPSPRPTLAPEKIAAYTPVEFPPVELAEPPVIPGETSAEAAAGPDLSVPAPPPPLTVARPAPAIAFAIPVDGPVQVVPGNTAGFVSGLGKNGTGLNGLGRGYGDERSEQPAPDYPAEALAQHQEGTVVVRLTISESGWVKSAYLVKPSQWPLLNDAALRAVLQKWRYAEGGPVRQVERSIRFKISK